MPDPMLTFCGRCGKHRPVSSPWEHDKKRSVWVCTFKCGHLGIIHQDTYADMTRKPCQAPADGSPCDEPAQADKRYCPRHLAQIQKLADAGRLP